VAHACETETVSPVSDVDDVAGKVTDSSLSLFDSEWILVDYKNAPLTTDLKYKATLKIDSCSCDVHLGSGRGFINVYSGLFKLDEKQSLVICVDDLISTLVGGTPKQNAAERKYFENLKTTKSYTLAGDNLALHFGNQEVGYFVRKK